MTDKNFDEIEEIIGVPPHTNGGAGTASTTTGNVIDELNEKYCVVLEGGKVRVLTFSHQHGRETVDYISFNDFRNLYLNKLVVVGKDKDGKDISMPLGHYWLKHPARRQYGRVTFDPCKPTVPGTLNLWRGWGVEPKAGDWSLMQQHILEVLASGNREHEQYILNYAAWCVQNPDKPAEVALVFKGPQGSGRGIFARALCRMFGQHAHQISSTKHLAGDFNKHLRDCCFLFSDEAFWPGYRDKEGNLKRLITEPTLMIEPKGLDLFEVKNMIHLVMVSNNAWVIPAALDARRFVIFIVADHKKQDPAWFKPLYEQMESGGYAAMLHDLLHRSLGEWHPRQIIKTEALHEQQMLSLDSLDPFDAWWFTLLNDGILPGYQGEVTVTEMKDPDVKPMFGDRVPKPKGWKKGQKVPVKVTKPGDPNPRRALSCLLYEHARDCTPRLKLESDHVLGRALRDHGCTPFNREGRGWEFPPLREAREAWQKRAPEQKWDHDLDDWQERTEREPRKW
jgi:hypothetical protein